MSTYTSIQSNTRTHMHTCIRTHSFRLPDAPPSNSTQQSQEDDKEEEVVLLRYGYRNNICPSREVQKY